MTRARGQPPRSVIEREYPHRVTVPAENVQGERLDVVILFHAQVGAPMHSRSLFKDDRWWATYYFADPQHARAFEALFGNEPQ